MSKITITICDLCKAKSEDPRGIQHIEFDFAEGCAFSGDACESCLELIRRGVRVHSRYNWPPLYLEAKPTPETPVIEHTAPAVPEIQ